MENCSETKTTSTDIRARIDAERNRLLMEQNLEAELGKDRLAPLEAGDDEALDRIETQISQCLDRQSRIRERVEILERRLAEAERAEREGELDTLAAETEAARAAAVKLIKQTYPLLASKLAALLSELVTTDDRITQANFRLAAAGRPEIESPNLCRLIPAETAAGHANAPAFLPEPLHLVIELPSVEQSHDAKAFYAPPMDGRLATLAGMFRNRG